MSKRPCPCCGQTNHDYVLNYTHCVAAMNDVFIDCDVCGGTGRVVIDYMVEHEAAAGGDPVLPCAKCDGRGKLPRDLVNWERTKVLFGHILDLFG